MESLRMVEIKRRARKKVRFPLEQRWLRSFVGFHGSNGVTSFVEEDLEVSLVQALEAICLGEVVSVEKCEGPGTECVVEHRSEGDPWIAVRLRFVSNEEKLHIFEARPWRETTNETPDAA